MPQVAPSVLAADFANLQQDCRRVLGPHSGMLHIDVMDGVFVPNISIGVPVLQSLKKALPTAEYDVHLMIVRPHLFVEAFADAGADRITVHLEAESAVEETLRAIRAKGCKAGLSLRPATPVQALWPHLPLVDQVLVMSVEPGFGGQAFMPEAVEKIRALRRECTRRQCAVEIEVDGGITPETAAPCWAAGADILVAGSAVFHQKDPQKAIQDILKPVQQ
ncbi:MAG: ribulose-phosphate 3-epimerase [Oscillospiraceae bacterium]